MTKSTIPTPDANSIGTRTIGCGQYARTITQLSIGTHVYALAPNGRVYQFCGRCGGSGILEQFGHVYGGQCFECAWTGVSGKSYPDIPAAQKTQRTRLVAAARKTRKAAEKVEAVEVAFLVWSAANRDLVDLLTALGSTADDSFLFDMVNAVTNLRRPLTDKQAAATVKALADRDTREAAKAEAAAMQRYAGNPGATVTVTGEVTYRDYFPSTNYGWSGTTLIIVTGTGTDEGVTVKLSGSGQALVGLERGDRVTVTGKVKDTAEYRDVKQTVIGPRPKIVVAEKVTG